MKPEPTTMKAAVIHRYGGNDEVHIEMVGIPEVAGKDVLIQVKAAGLNPIDSRIRDGKLKQVLPFKLPLILGHDLAGVVVGTGSDVARFKVGDEVYARCDTRRIGSFAEYIAVREDNLSLKPSNLTMEEAAAIPLVGLTAWQILVGKAGIQKGQKVLIHGGAGGVGSVAIQLAKYLGAYVATTASNADFESVKKYGADEAIDYRSEDFSTILKDYDLVLDTRGGETLEKSFKVLKRGGSLVSIAGTPDMNMARQLELNPMLKLAMYAMSFKNNRKAKSLDVSYSFHFMWPSGEQLSELGSLLQSGAIKPVVDKVFPFESIKEALAYSESGKAKGKVVISMNGIGA